MPQRSAHRTSRRRSGDRPLRQRLEDEARFLKSWFDNPLLAGAIVPSSPVLARAMAAAVDPASTGPVIELGPGTGPVTEALVARGIDEARLVLVEFDPDFCRLLTERFPRARIVNGDAYGLARTLRDAVPGGAAAIVSSLPLLTRPERDRIRLLEQAFGLLQPGAPFVQFTYGLGSPVPRTGIDAEATVSPPVWRNIPPARVWVYRSVPATRRTAERRRDDDLLDRLAGKVRERAVRLRQGMTKSTGRVRHAWKERTETLRNDHRVKPTLDWIKRIEAHLEGPDTHVVADADLRTAKVPARGPQA